MMIGLSKVSRFKPIVKVNEGSIYLHVYLVRAVLFLNIFVQIYIHELKGRTQLVTGFATSWKVSKFVPNCLI